MLATIFPYCQMVHIKTWLLNTLLMKLRSGKGTLIERAIVLIHKAQSVGLINVS
jgi:hypothetical protein